MMIIRNKSAINNGHDESALCQQQQQYILFYFLPTSDFTNGKKLCGLDSKPMQKQTHTRLKSEGKK